MSIETLRTFGTSLPSNWSLNNRFKDSALRDDDDGSTLYITGAAVPPVYDRLTLNNPVAIGAADTINWVRVRFRAKDDGGGDNRMRGNQVLSGVKNNGAGAGWALSADYADYEEATFAAKPGGGAWTLADLNNLEIEIEMMACDLTKRIDCSEVYVDVDITPQAGGLAPYLIMDEGHR